MLLDGLTSFGHSHEKDTPFSKVLLLSVAVVEFRSSCFSGKFKDSVLSLFMFFYGVIGMGHKANKPI